MPGPFSFVDGCRKPEGGAANFVQGSVISLAPEAMKVDPLHLTPSVVFTPTATEFAQDVEITKNRLLLTTLENVQGRVYTYLTRKLMD